MRWELRLQERASKTIRKYKFCEEDEWREDEAMAAESLLVALKRKAAAQRQTLQQSGFGVDGADEDAWLWGKSEPSYESLLRDACQQLQRADGDDERSALYESVSQRLLDRVRRRVVSCDDCKIAEDLLEVARDEGLDLDSWDVVRSVAGNDEERCERCMDVARLVRRRLGQVKSWDGRIEERIPVDVGELHMPAVKAALGALIPANLHPRLDKAVAKGKLAVDVPRGGSFVRFDGWRVSVYEVESLARGRLDSGMFEFFLKVLERCSSLLQLCVV